MKQYSKAERLAICEALSAELGSVEITPRDLVSAAANPEHPAHAAFEWNDGTAAHQHRLAQARSFIVVYVPSVVSVSTQENDV